MKSRNQPPRRSAAGNGSAKASPRRFNVNESAELLAFLLEKLSGQGRNSVKSMLARGQIAVDDRVEKAYNFKLEPGQTVCVHKEAPSAGPAFAGLRILHEDDDLIVIHKDAGLLSVATPQEKELTAYRQLTAHVREDDPHNRIFVLHRLDRDTSGVMMFAKSERVQRLMQENWKDVVKERLYVALVEGEVRKPVDTVQSWLKESATLKMYSSPYPNDGQHAVTHYRTLQTSRAYSLLEVTLETGRKNQIRVHMQDIGHPIAGDKKYGARTKPFNRLGLHARVLAFDHPASGRLMRFETDVPQTFLNALADQSPR